MNCHDVAAALDERALEYLAADARRTIEAAIEAHADKCDECRSALEAVRALASDPIPPLPRIDVARLVADHAGSSGRTERPRPSLALRPAIFGVLAVGGAAFAALGVIAIGAFDRGSGGDATSEGQNARSALVAAAPSSGVESAAQRSLIDFVEAEEAAASDALRAELLRSPVPPEGDMFALLKVPPRYPSSAARRGLEGHAVVEFTVTPEGDVAEPFIVESSDPIFEEPTLEAIRRAKYKPRVVNGEPLAVEGIRNRFTYVVEDPSAETSRNDDAVMESPSAEADLDWQEFRALLVPALDCVERADLLCVELELDRISATYVLDRRQTSDLSRIYGFVFHRLGDYERAIAAYEDSARALEESGAGTGNYSAQPWMTAALIHYERHRYQEALDAALRYLRAAESPMPADYVFVDRLRQLGAVVR